MTFDVGQRVAYAALGPGGNKARLRFGVVTAYDANRGWFTKDRSEDPSAVQIQCDIDGVKRWFPTCNAVGV